MLESAVLLLPAHLPLSLCGHRSRRQRLEQLPLQASHICRAACALLQGLHGGDATDAQPEHLLPAPEQACLQDWASVNTAQLAMQTVLNFDTGHSGSGAVFDPDRARGRFQNRCTGRESPQAAQMAELIVTTDSLRSLH